MLLLHIWSHIDTHMLQQHNNNIKYSMSMWMSNSIKRKQSLLLIFRWKKEMCHLSTSYHFSFYFFFVCSLHIYSLYALHYLCMLDWLYIFLLTTMYVLSRQIVGQSPRVGRSLFSNWFLFTNHEKHYFWSGSQFRYTFYEPTILVTWSQLIEVSFSSW